MDDWRTLDAAAVSFGDDDEVIVVAVAGDDEKGESEVDPEKSTRRCFPLLLQKTAADGRRRQQH